MYSADRSDSCQPLEHEDLVVVLEGIVETFGLESPLRKQFMSDIATIIGVLTDQIVIISVKTGSIIVKMGFLRVASSKVSPIAAVQNLTRAASSGSLDSFRLKSIFYNNTLIAERIVYSDVSAPLPSNAPLIIGISFGGFTVVALVAAGIYFRRRQWEVEQAEVERSKQREEFVKHLQSFTEIPPRDITFDDSFKPLRGGFGVVRKGDWKGVEVAVKTFDKGPARDFELFISEAKVMHRIYHPNCIRMYGVSYDNREQSFVMEWMDGGDLANYIAPPPSIDKQSPRKPALHKRISLFRQVCAGLFYLHSHNIMHGDIKAENILLNQKGEAKIANCGMSKIKAQNARASTSVSSFNVDGSFKYLAPEILCERQPASLHSDVYSLGAVFLELLVWQPIWIDKSILQIALAHVNKERPDFPSDIGDKSEEFRALLLDCWKRIPDQRPTACQVWKRISILDKNNPEFNKPLDPYPKGFLPTCKTLEDCIQKALPIHAFNIILQDIPDIDKMFLNLTVQALVSLFELTELETKCIIAYTLVSKQRDIGGVQLPYNQNLFFLFCKAYKERDEDALLKFADFSFHFWNGLAKLPKQQPLVFWGLKQRLEDINDLYKVDNDVHWHYPSSSTTELDVSKEFFNGGTLFRFDGVTDARSIEPFSLAPNEKEFLLPYTSKFKVIVALPCEQARLLDSFGHLPSDVDLVVLECCSVPLTRSAYDHAIPSTGMLQRRMSLVSHLKQHLQVVDAEGVVAPLETTLRATAAEKPLPAFLKQLPTAAAKVLPTQASKSTVGLQQSSSAQRREDALFSRQLDSLMSPRLQPHDVRVEVTVDKAPGQVWAAHATAGIELNAAPPRPSYPACAGTGHAQTALAEGANKAWVKHFARPFPRQQAQRALGRDTPLQVTSGRSGSHHGRSTASGIEPAWNEDIEL
jgi:serine/threonine protein kinase